jgi:hypothetical protein
MEAIEKSDKKCPLCYLSVSTEERHMDHLLTNEVVMDPGFREKVLAARGFCNHHAHLLYRESREPHTQDGLGYCIYMKDIIGEIAEKLGSATIDMMNELEASAKSSIVTRRRKLRRTTKSFGDIVEETVRGQEQCPVCEFLWSMDEIYLSTLLQMLDDREFREGFELSGGVCLPHFVSAIQMIGHSKPKRPIDVAQTLVKTEMRRLQLIAGYLSEFARKHSWEFSHERYGPEAEANLMALLALVGVEGLDCIRDKTLS